MLSRLVITYFGTRLLDAPNSRSSHSSPTPRGGGIALAIGAIVATITAWQFGYISNHTLYWFLIPTSLIAILGIFDDLFNLGIGLRLTIQFLLASTGTFLIAPFDEPSLSLQIFAAVIMIFFLVWMANLYNFMDGINGLAAFEAISVCLGMGFIYWNEGTGKETIYLMIVMATSACGFLYWNFPKAKLFMGDSGSLFLGIALGLLTVESLEESSSIAFAWLIMLGVFIVDASYTLFIRIATKQAFHQAHRTHAYQKISIRLKSHSRTTLSVVAINLLWLFPIALAAATNKIHPVLAIIAAYTPLLIIATRCNAGRPSQH